MKDQEDISSRYKLGRVVEIKPSRMDGIHRRIVLEYRPTYHLRSDKTAYANPKSFSTTERPIQNLVLIIPGDYKEIKISED